MGWTDEVSAESDLAGNVTEHYIFFNGQRIARRDASTGNVHYYSSDHLGTHSLVSDANGTMPPQEESDFYPFGGEIPISGSDTNHYKFTGKERDAESGLDNFGARYNASSLGRFMTPDWAAKPTSVPYAKFGDPQTLNLYAYVENAPLNRADADGHCAEDLCIGEAIAVTALFAYVSSPAGQQVIRNGINALANTPKVVQGLFRSGNKSSSPPATSTSHSTPANPNNPPGSGGKKGDSDKTDTTRVTHYTSDQGSKSDYG
jgi:RHS repeat-associated protein